MRLSLQGNAIIQAFGSARFAGSLYRSLSSHLGKLVVCVAFTAALFYWGAEGLRSKASEASANYATLAAKALPDVKGYRAAQEARPPHRKGEATLKAFGTGLMDILWLYKEFFEMGAEHLNLMVGSHYSPIRDQPPSVDDGAGGMKPSKNLIHLERHP